MKVYKKNLPDGVKKCFGYDKGVKVKLINKKYLKKKNNKTNEKYFFTRLFILCISLFLKKRNYLSFPNNSSKCKNMSI